MAIRLVEPGGGVMAVVVATACVVNPVGRKSQLGILVQAVWGADLVLQLLLGLRKHVLHEVVVLQGPAVRVLGDLMCICRHWPAIGER